MPWNERTRQSGVSPGSLAGEVGDPAAVVEGAPSFAAKVIPAVVPSTPAVVGAEAPFGEPWPAPAPPQPAVAATVVAPGICGGSWGASGVPAGVPLDTVVSATGAAVAGSSEPPVAGVAADRGAAGAVIAGRL
jgi:hypothetical protein